MNFYPTLDLVLTRDIDAPREVLYACWTQPEHLVHFFVPKPHRVTACTLDVIPNEKLVFTDTYTAGWKPAPEPFMTAIITFEDIGNGRTRYTAIARHRNPETAQTQKYMGFYDGWGTVVDQLEAYAKTL